MLMTTVYIFAFVFVLSLVVLVHEGGHFAVARWCGVYVTEFSLGFGKELWGWNDKKGTRWKICAIPLGGYVKMLGDEDAASAKSSENNVPEEMKPFTFMAQKLWKRALIIFAGPAMNYIFAVLIFTGVFWYRGEMSILPVVGEVEAGSVAEEAGFQPGDVFVEINGHQIKDFSDIQRATRLTEFEKPMHITFDRGGEEVKVTVFARYDAELKQQRLGFKSSPDAIVFNDNIGFVRAFNTAVEMVVNLTTDTLIYLGQVITVQRAADDMRGPLGIAEMSGDALINGWVSLALFIAQISVAIGLMNLLPIPVLDGGHLLFYAVEAIIRRPLSEKVQNAFLWAGLAVLLMLVAYTFILDVPRIIQRVFG